MREPARVQIRWWVGGCLVGPHDVAVDIKNGGGRVVVGGGALLEGTHLVEEFAHVAGTGTGGGLVGHRGDPFDVSGFKEGADGHEHEADGAVAAYEVFLTAVEGGIDDGLVDGVENDGGAVCHAKGGCSVDPVAVPAGGTELGMDGFGVATALAGEDYVHLFERVDVGRIDKSGLFLSKVRSGLACLRGGEKGGFDVCKIVFCLHAFDKYGANHAAPSNDTCFHFYFS